MKMKVLDYVERIEHIEVELTKLNAARSLTERERRLEVTVSGSCTLLRDLNDPASMYYNRIKGFGPADAAHVDRLLTHYDENNAPVVDMTPDRLTAETASALIERGYQPVQQLAFMRAAPWIGEADRETSLRIEQVGERNAEEFIRWIGLSKGGTEFSPHVVKRVEKYFYRPDFRNYMLTIGGEPAAMGSLFLHGPEAYLANDYTFEAFRGRGCQTALLRHRLAAAAELGAEDIYTDVEFGSVSHNNMGKAGFETVFVNTFWVKR